MSTCSLHKWTFVAIFGLISSYSGTKLVRYSSDLNGWNLDHKLVWGEGAGNRNAVVSTVIPLSTDTMHSEQCEKSVSPSRMGRKAGTKEGQNEKKVKTPEKCRAWVWFNWKPDLQSHLFAHMIISQPLSCCYTVCNPSFLYCKIPLVSIILSLGSDHTVTWFSASHGFHSTQPHQSLPLEKRTRGNKKCPQSC